jgi:S-disulfanyl-L-cysteine oxidoreductase SoxD
MLRSGLIIALLTVACGGGGGATTPPNTPTNEKTGTTAAPGKKDMTLDEQVAAGEKVYAERCAVCHGKDGTGGKKAPALVGPKALDDYHNAKEAYTYIHDMMPTTAPGSLTEEEYWNVTAFLIKKNDLGGIKDPLNAASSESVKWSR